MYFEPSDTFNTSFRAFLETAFSYTQIKPAFREKLLEASNSCY